MNIECKYKSIPENVNYIIDELLNHYSFKEEKINIVDTALILTVEDTIKLNRYIDLSTGGQMSSSCINNVLTLKKLNLTGVAKSINNHFPSLYIVADTAKSAIYYLEINSLNSIKDTEQQLKNDYGLMFKKTYIDVVTYKYSKTE